MATTRKELEYRCSDDCIQSGCPQHTARMSYESVCDIIYFVDGKHIEISFERGSLRAFFDLYKELLKSRADMYNPFKESV